MSSESGPRPESSRDTLFYENQRSLEKLAHETIRRGVDPDDLAGIVVDADDPVWKVFAERLMPGPAIQAIRDRGEFPHIHGIITGENLEGVIDRVPDLLPIFEMVLAPGTARAIVFADSGFSVYLLKPKPHRARSS
jgi:hypothetical protein